MRRAARLRVLFWHFRRGGIPAVVTSWQRGRSVFPPGSVNGIQHAVGEWTSGKLSKQLAFAGAMIPSAIPRRAVRVAIILDEFSAMAFSYEWDTVVLTPENWRQIVAEDSVDLLFVESAWSGSSGSWQYQLTGQTGPSPIIQELIGAFRARNVPTVFWNKEDPPHYSDFLPAAALFDYVFTSDSSMVDEYQRDLGHDRVAPLTFAAQPSIHNPVRPKLGWQERDVAFAGMYFGHKFPERRDQMDLLLGAAAKVSASMDTGLEIFSRQLGGKDTYQFPPYLLPYVKGSLPYDQMLTAYKAYKVFLNVNSVVTSPSMCARRVFEITASGTPVVSTRSKAIDNFFPPSEVAVVDSEEEARSTISTLVRQPSLRERQVHLAQRRIWQHHTYAHRAEQVLAVATPALARPVELPTVSVIVSTIRPHQIEHVFRTVSSQREVSPELILLTHGFALDADRLNALRSENPVSALTVLSAPADQSLGECLNDCVEAASGTILTKMDDDDFYAPHYLLDQLHALTYSRAQVVGKQAHFMYLRSYDATLLRFPQREHRYTSLVMGPTIMAARDVFRDFPFEQRDRGEDTAFLNSITVASGTIYSTDKFNYYQQRNGAGHTWQVSDQELLAAADIVFYGRPDQHVSI